MSWRLLGAVGSPRLPGLSTLYSSLKGWARQVPALSPAPHTRLPWGGQAFSPPSAGKGKGGTGMFSVQGGSATPRGSPENTSVRAVFALPGVPFSSMGQGCSGGAIRG